MNLPEQLSLRQIVEYGSFSTLIQFQVLHSPIDGSNSVVIDLQSTPRDKGNVQLKCYRVMSLELAIPYSFPQLEELRIIDVRHRQLEDLHFLVESESTVARFRFYCEVIQAQFSPRNLAT